MYTEPEEEGQESEDQPITLHLIAQHLYSLMVDTDMIPDSLSQELSETIEEINPRHIKPSEDTLVITEEGILHNPQDTEEYAKGIILGMILFIRETLQDTDTDDEEEGEEEQ